MKAYRSATLLLFLVLLRAPAGAESPRPGPFTDVPVQQWPYDAVQTVAQEGLFTGYPDGTFSGKRALTRYEFAVALQRMLQEADRTARSDAGAAHRSRIVATQLLKLAQEFRPELAMLGADADKEFGWLQEWRAAGRKPVVLPEERLLDPATLRTAEAREGARRASREWSEGRAVVYTSASAGMVSLHPQTGLPYRTVARGTDPATLRLIVGHNAEISRLIERYGLPAYARLPWMPEILHPESVWSDRSHPKRQLGGGLLATASPDRKLTVVLRRNESGECAHLSVSTRQRTFDVELPATQILGNRIEIAWGAPKLDLLFVRWRLTGGSAWEYRVIDLRTGAPLVSVAG
jgi:hypothetical protein